jgi:hypothetical protein
MTLPVRAGWPTDPLIPPEAYPDLLHADAERHTVGLPWLTGVFKVAAPRSLTLRVRVLNRAGIPVVEGEGQLEVGQRQFVLSNLHAIGIEAYSHKRDPERIQVAQRIWSRCTQAILMVSSRSQSSR